MTSLIMHMSIFRNQRTALESFGESTGNTGIHWRAPWRELFFVTRSIVQTAYLAAYLTKAQSYEVSYDSRSATNTRSTSSKSCFHSPCQLPGLLLNSFLSAFWTSSGILLLRKCRVIPSASFFSSRAVVRQLARHIHGHITTNPERCSRCHPASVRHVIRLAGPLKFPEAYYAPGATLQLTLFPNANIADRLKPPPRRHFDAL